VSFLLLLMVGGLVRTRLDCEALVLAARSVDIEVLGGELPSQIGVLGGGLGAFSSESWPLGNPARWLVPVKPRALLFSPVRLGYPSIVSGNRAVFEP